MQYNIHITIGHNVDGKPKHNIKAVTKAVYNTLDIEAFTAFGCLGMWRGEAEDSTRIEINNISASEADRINALIPELARQLEQVEIMFEKFESNTQFIAAKADEIETRA